MPVNNLDNLINKLYKDGIDKIKSESAELKKQKEEEADKLISSAQNKADNIIKKAQEEADRMLSRTQKEMQKVHDNILLSLKESISSAIVHKVFDKKKLANILDSKTFIKDTLSNLFKNWSENTDINLYFSKLQKSDIETIIAEEFKNIVSDNFSIKYNESDKKGFSIKDSGETYKITFDEETVHNLFTENLKPYVKEIIFGLEK